MVRRALVFVLIVLLVSQPIRAQQPVTVSDAPQVPAGTIDSPAYVLVRLKDGTGVRGYLVDVTPDALHVRAREREGRVRALPVAQVVSIERQNRGEVAKTVSKAVLYTAALIGLAALGLILGLSSE